MFNIKLLGKNHYERLWKNKAIYPGYCLLPTIAFC